MSSIKLKDLFSDPPKHRKMKAVIFHGPGDLRFETVNIPPLKEGEVLLQIETALTCGTDFKAFRQGHPVLLNNQLPSPFGHEVTGRISEMDPHVKGFEIGERVAAANSAPCDDCFYCRKNLPNLCENRFLLNGAYAQYLVIPRQIVKHNLYAIPKGLDGKTAALAEPLACVVRALDQMNLKEHESLAILGCGLMGSLMVQVAKAQNLNVTAIGRSYEKLERAKILGADQAISITDLEDPVREILKLSPEGRGFDQVVEAVGQPESWSQAVQLARRGGTVCFYGGCRAGSTFEFDTHRLHYEELKILGSFHHTPEHFARAIQLLCQGKINSAFFIRGEITLSQLPGHFTEMCEKPFQKVAVLPDLPTR